MQKLTLDQFDFNLPAHLIAQKPLACKEDAKLLHVSHQQFTSYQIKDLPQLINKNDILVFNNTKVIPVKLIGKRGEATISINLHKKIDATHWLAYAKNSRRLKANDEIIFNQDFKCKLMEKYPSGEIKLQFDYPNIYEKLHQFGLMPLPPYIKRSNLQNPNDINNKNDYTDYQSIFAQVDGAVASPTASLHFSHDLVKQIEAKGIAYTFITLHVGAGTFLPVKENDITKHIMHEEYGELSSEAINKIQTAIDNGGRVIAVGTTTLRVLEYVYLKYNKLQEFAGSIDLFTYPGFKFKIIDGLITNFHLPQSTLFMLVSAFCSLKTMQSAYQYAIDNNYRFFSYGDCCFLEKEPYN